MRLSYRPHIVSDQKSVHPTLAYRGGGSPCPDDHPWSGPFGFGPIPRQLDAITVGIAEIKCLANTVIARAFEANASIVQPAQCIGQRCPRRTANSNMVEPGSMRPWRRAAFAFPGVQSNVVVITACRKERSFMPIALHQIKAEYATIESNGTI